MVEVFSTTAVAMAGLSMGLTVGSTLARRRGGTPPPEAPACPSPGATKPITTRSVLQEHARAIGIDRSKSWIHRATCRELQEAIRAHNEQRRAING